MARQSAISLLKRRCSPLLLASLLCGALPALAAANKAGEVVLARGVATAHTGTTAARIVGPGSVIFEGDVVTTGPRSLALLKLEDGTRVTLRPETSFQVEEFSTAANDERGVLRLFKGGLRAVTGFMSKRNPKAMRLRTSLATIGIRGTEFDARICGADCAAEAKVSSLPAGRAGFVKGNVLARAAGGERARALKAGAPVYNGESVLSSGESYAVLAFRDRSRVTLLPNTEFRIDQLTFDDAAPEQGRGVFSLLRGGLRAVSGAIGKYGNRAYQMRTAVATIGIRGSGYDLYCQGTCQNLAEAVDPSGDGLSVDVWEDAIVVDETHQLDQGDTVFIGRSGMDPVPIPEMPVTITAPRPNEVEVPEPPPQPAAAPAEGLYVSCYVGNCTVETPENTVELAPGEAGHVGAEGGPVQELEGGIPDLAAGDVILNSVGENQIQNQLDDVLEGGGSECTVR